MFFSLVPQIFKICAPNSRKLVNYFELVNKMENQCLCQFEI